MTIYEKFKASFKRRPRRGIRLSSKEKEKLFRLLDMCQSLNNKLTVENYHHHQLLHVIYPMLLDLVQAHACCRKGDDPEPHIEKAIHGYIACMGQDAIMALRIGYAVLIVDEKFLCN